MTDEFEQMEEVMSLVISGYSPAKISEKMGIDKKTVKRLMTEWLRNLRIDDENRRSGGML